MLALKTFAGVRVIAAPRALDNAAWHPESIAIRISADDLFVIAESVGSPGAMALLAADPDAIIEAETGFVGSWLNGAQMSTIATHIEWHLPTQRPALAQGFIAGVPAKLWLTNSAALLLCGVANAHDLIERTS